MLTRETRLDSFLILGDPADKAKFRTMSYLIPHGKLKMAKKGKYGRICCYENANINITDFPWIYNQENDVDIISWVNDLIYVLKNFEINGIILCNSGTGHLSEEEIFVIKLLQKICILEENKTDVIWKSIFYFITKDLNNLSEGVDPLQFLE